MWEMISSAFKAIASFFASQGTPQERENVDKEKAQDSKTQKIEEIRQKLRAEQDARLKKEAIDAAQVALDKMNQPKGGF